MKAVSDRALLSLLLYHGLRREELSALTVHNVHLRRGVPHLRVHGKGDKVWNVPLHPGTQGLLADYLEASGHALDKSGPLFRPSRNSRTGELDRTLSGDGIYKLLRSYAKKLGVTIGVHALRATAATNDERARARGGHLQGAGVARPREHCDHWPLRPPQEETGRLPDIQSQLLARVSSKERFSRFSKIGQEIRAH